MVLLEFRVPLPLHVDEFQVAQLFMVIEASKQNTGDGEGVEWIKNEPYDNTDGHMGVSPITNTEVPRTKGQYTLKNYHIASKVPGLVAAMLPTDAMILVEEAWNAYPHCKTVLTNGYLDNKKFKICIETMHAPDNGSQENALGLDAARLKKRSVETLDILDDIDTTAEDYKEEEDPRIFKSTTTGRGELTTGWAETADPVMTCYKLVDAEFAYWGLQTKVERTITDSQRKLFRTTLRQAFTLIDKWHGLTMEDIRRLEAESKAELNKTLAETGANVDETTAAERDASAGAAGGAGGAGGAASAGAADATPAADAAKDKGAEAPAEA
mmetsp:Transcript_27881/g.65818  ORF Transcript_27881/g.65818 Transcript_27881/m.65818 type:complete len:326 (-) Transcript_27881:57-1034(-)